MVGPGLLLRAVRAPSLTAGAMPVLTCTALAHGQGHALDASATALTLVGMLAAQCAANLFNDYYDHQSGLDADPEFARNPFPLGSRVIQSGALSARGVLGLALGFSAVALTCGLALNARQDGHVVLAIAGVAGLLAYFYTAPPLKLAYRGVGEPVTFLLFGPLAGAGTYYVQTGHVDAACLWVSSIVGLLAMAILYMHHFPQHAADRRHGKRTPVVRLGPRGAGRLVAPVLLLPYGLVAAGIPLGWLPPAAGLFALTLPLALSAVRTARATPDEPRPMTGAFGRVLGLHFTGCLLLSGGLLLGR